MSWFEAYMLWRLDTINATLIALIAACGFHHMIGWLVYGLEGYDMEEATKTTMKKWFVRSGVIAGICAVLLVIVPSTTEVFKIIATKKGVDAIQSDTTAKYLSDADKAITNGMKLLNQEIEKKLDKKVSK
jgi:hypothetical protein